MTSHSNYDNSCSYDHHYPNGYNLTKHPTCDSVRRERRRLLHAQQQLQLQQQQPQYISPASTHDITYYMSCYLAGGLSSSIRWVLSPLELIKTRLQTSSSATTSSVAMSSNYLSPALSIGRGVTIPVIAGNHTNTMLSTFVHIYKHEGTTGLFRGVGPTAVAYWLQTSTKYTLYEFIKDQLSSTSHTNSDKNYNNNDSRWKRNLIYVTAAASAEAIADVLMCPFEMLKVKMQTAMNTTGYNSVAGIGTKSTTFPKQFVPALQEMIKNRSMYNFPFGSLGPVWGRQIPGTIVNFFTFENAVSLIYTTMGNTNKSDYTPTQQLGVTVLAGYIAGVCCAIVSHPADSIISLKSLPEYHGMSIQQIISRVGWYRLTTKGLLPRIVMTGQIIAFQWLLYDSIKSSFGYGTSGGNK